MKAIDGRIYNVLVEEWIAADIKHNSAPTYRFKEWCLRTYGVMICSVTVFTFDDPNKEFLFKLRFSHVL